MVGDTAKVGKLFAHRIETDDLFDESGIDFLSSHAAEETFVPSAAIRWLVLVHLWVGIFNDELVFICNDFQISFPT